jgi:Sulfotransferase domain
MFPATVFLVELQELYPDAEVIVVTRNKENWFESVNALEKSTRWDIVPVLEVLLFPCSGWRWLPLVITLTVLDLDESVAWFPNAAIELNGKLLGSRVRRHQLYSRKYIF